MPSPEKKLCAKNYAILSKFLVGPLLLSYITTESGGGDYPPVLKVGDLSPCPPCSDAYGYTSRFSCCHFVVVALCCNAVYSNDNEVIIETRSDYDSSERRRKITRNVCDKNINQNDPFYVDKAQAYWSIYCQTRFLRLI